MGGRGILRTAQTTAIPSPSETPWARPASQSRTAEERTHSLPAAEQEPLVNNTSLEPPSPRVQQESGDHTSQDALSQSATASEAAAGAQKEQMGLQLQAVRNLSASSVEKPGTPPRLTSPKSPQPVSSAAAHDGTLRDASADQPGSMASPVGASAAEGCKWCGAGCPRSITGPTR